MNEQIYFSKIKYAKPYRWNHIYLFTFSILILILSYIRYVVLKEAAAAAAEASRRNANSVLCRTLNQVLMRTSWIEATRPATITTMPEARRTAAKRKVKLAKTAKKAKIK